MRLAPFIAAVVLEGSSSLMQPSSLKGVFEASYPTLGSCRLTIDAGQYNIECEDKRLASGRALSFDGLLVLANDAEASSILTIPTAAELHRRLHMERHKSVPATSESSPNLMLDSLSFAVVESGATMYLVESGHERAFCRMERRRLDIAHLRGLHVFVGSSATIAPQTKGPEPAAFCNVE